MSQKHLAISAILVGIAALCWTFGKNFDASFEDGSFVTIVMLGIGGTVLVIIGFLWLGLLAFVGSE